MKIGADSLAASSSIYMYVWRVPGRVPGLILLQRVHGEQCPLEGA